MEFIGFISRAFPAETFTRDGKERTVQSFLIEENDEDSDWKGQSLVVDVWDGYLTNWMAEHVGERITAQCRVRAIPTKDGARCFNKFSLQNIVYKGSPLWRPPAT